MTAADLIAYVEEYDVEKHAFITSCYWTATALIDAEVGAVAVPTEVLELWRNEVGAQLVRRRSAPGGATQFAIAGEQGAVRVSQDPLAPIRPMIRLYQGPVIA